MTGLSSTMNALSWVMDDRSSSRAGRRLRRSTGHSGRQRRGKARDGHALRGWRIGRVSGTAPSRANERSAISLCGNRPTSALHRLPCSSARARRAAAPRPRRDARRRLQALHRVVHARRDRHPDAGRRPAGRRSHRQGLGNTGILEQALASGAVDLYPEYTGTIVRELLKREGNPSLDELNRWLAPRGLVAAVPFGFNNTYALAMTRSARRRASASRASPTSLGAGRRAASSACRTSSCSAPTAGRRCSQAYGAARRRADRPRPRPGLRRASRRARST